MFNQTFIHINCGFKAAHAYATILKQDFLAHCTKFHQYGC